MNLKIVLICILFFLASLVAVGDSIYMGTEIYLPSGWNEGKMIYSTNVGANFVAPSPIFDKPTKTGASLNIKRVIIERNTVIYKIAPNMFVKDNKKRFCKIEHNKVYTINGKKYKAIGQTKQGIHFLDTTKKKVYVVPAVRVVKKKK